MPFQVWTRRWEKAGAPLLTEDGALGLMASVAIEEGCEAMVVPVEDGDPNDWEDDWEEPEDVDPTDILDED